MFNIRMSTISYAFLIVVVASVTAQAQPFGVGHKDAHASVESEMRGSQISLAALSPADSEDGER